MTQHIPGCPNQFGEGPCLECESELYSYDQYELQQESCGAVSTFFKAVCAEEPEHIWEHKGELPNGDTVIWDYDWETADEAHR